MAIIRINKNIFSDESQEKQVESGKTIEECLCDFNEPVFHKGSVEVYDCDTGETTYAEISDDDEYLNAVIIVNGEDKGLDYVIKENDIVSVTFYPGNGDTGTIWKNIGLAAAGVALIVAGIAISVASYGSLSGVGLQAALWGAGLLGGIGAAAIATSVTGFVSGDFLPATIWDYLTKKLSDGSNSSGKSLKQIPNVRNAKNETIIGNTIPFVMGTQQVAPFITGSPFYDISGDRGTIQYITLLYCVGYAPLKLTDFKLSDIYLARNKDVTSGDHDTVMHGMLRGYSDTTGDIEDKWRYNDVSLEIIQKGDDYGTLYNKKIIAESVSAYVLHIYDTELSEIQYGGAELASGYRTNTVKFTQSCPYEISVELYLASGFYRTRSESSDSSSKVVYNTMPCWVAIQYRFYKDDTETYNSAEYYKGDATYDGGWNNFTSLNDGFITLSDYTSSARSDENSYHEGDSLDTNYNDGWINGKAFNLSPLEDGSGSGVTQIRLVASHTFTVEECAEIAGIIKDSSGNKYADLTTLQVRVVRLSPQYCAQETSDSSSKGTWSYVESIKWNYLTSKCFDNDKLSDYYKTNGSLPSSIDDYVLKPCNSTNLNNACYVALKVKADSAGEIASELDKLSVTAESLAPKYNDTDKTWYPEIVTNTKKYYGAPVYNSTLGKYEMGAEITESQYITDRQSGIKAIEYDAGSNMVSQIKDEVFNTSGKYPSTTFVYIGENNNSNNIIHLYNSRKEGLVDNISLKGYTSTCVCTDGNYVYTVSNNISGSSPSYSFVSKINISTGKTVSTVTVALASVVEYYDDKYIYITHENDKVTIINPTDMTVLNETTLSLPSSSSPHNIFSTGTYAYIVCLGSSTTTIYKINISDFSTSSFTTPSTSSAGGGICGDSTYLYICVGSTLYVYNISTDSLVSTISIGIILTDIVYYEGYIYGCSSSSFYKISSGTSPSVLGTVAKSVSGDTTGLSNDDNYFYITTAATSSGTIDVILISSLSIYKSISLSFVPGQTACTSYNSSGYKLSDDLNTKYVTNNPASMFLLATCGILLKRESLEYYAQNKDSSGNIAVGDINMQSCTEAYQFCEDVTDGSTYEEGDAEYVSGSTNIRHMKFGCNGYIYNATKLDDILSNICICARGVYTIDNIMRLTIVVDKPNDCSVGIINQSNCIDASNSISFADIPSGYKMTYPNEDDGYQEDVLYAMDDGEDYTNPLKEITDLTLKYVTNTYQSWSLARYCLGSAKINKEVITRTMGAAGYSVMIGDVMDVQDLNILIGTDHGGHIQSLIEDDDYIYGFICDNTFEYTGEVNTSGLCIQGVKILQPTQWQSSRVISVRMATTAGITETDGTIVIPTIGTTNQVVFAVKIVKDTGKPYDDSASVITYLPEAGDIVAFGEVDEITAQYKISKITHSEKNQFQLYLVTYDEDLYNYGAKLPSYNSHLNRPASISDITNLDFTVTQNDVDKAASNATNGVWSQVSAEYPTNIAIRYSFDEMPDLPDDSGNVSGDIVANLNNYTITGDKNLWTCVASGIDPYLRISKTELGLTAPFILCYDAFISVLNGNTPIAEGYMFYTDGTYSALASQLIVPSSTEWKSCKILLTPTSGKTVSYIRLDLIGDAPSATSTVLLKNIYIGDGTTTQPIIDNVSGSANATGSGVVSVPGVSGKACQFVGLKAIQLDLSKYANAQSWWESFWVNYTADHLAPVRRFFNFGDKEYSLADYTENPYFRTYNGSSVLNVECPYTLIGDGQSHHIVVSTVIASSSSAVKKLYIDGALYATATSTADFTSLTVGTGYIGGEGVSINVMSGYQDDWCFGVGEITAAQVLGLYLDRGAHAKLYSLADYKIDSSITSYSISANNSAFTKSRSGAVSPSTITVSAKAVINEVPAAYAGRFIIYTTTDGTNWSSVYTSSANESFHTYTIASGISGIKDELYKAGGTTSLVATQTYAIPYAADVAPQYMGIGILTSTSTKAFTGATVADDGTITTGSTMSNIISGDWMVNYSGALTTGIYYWSGTAWVITTDSKYTSDGTIIDIARLNVGGVVLTAWTSYANLIATNLFSHKIKVIDLNSESGCIYGGDRFNSDGSIADRSKNGYYLSNTGEIWANLQSDDLYNTIAGTGAGLALQSSSGDLGKYNSLYGYQAGYNISTGYSNTCNGYYAGRYITTGNDNTCNGVYAGYLITTGYANTCNGFYAGGDITTGYFNTCNGDYSGINIRTGHDNLADGYFTRIYRDDWSYQMNFGNRKMYLEFASTATQDTVYKAIAHYITSSSDNNSGGAGIYNTTELTRLNRNGTSVYFITNGNITALQCTSGDPTQIGHALQMEFIIPATPTNA